MHVAMVSEHASPLAGPGGPDAGGQNVYVRELALALAAAGHRVTVLTRRASPEPPDVVEIDAGVSGGSVLVRHIEAGPAARVPEDRLVAHVPKFAEEVERVWRSDDGKLLSSVSRARPG